MNSIRDIFLLFSSQPRKIGEEIDRVMDDNNKNFAYNYEPNDCSAEENDNEKI